MTGNQLTYWANIERERANAAAEALDKARINAQRYAAQLNYAASVRNAQLNYDIAMKNLEAAQKRHEDTLQQEYDNMFFKKYGILGLIGSTKYTGTESQHSAMGYLNNALASTMELLSGGYLKAPTNTQYSLSLLKKYQNPNWGNGRTSPSHFNAGW